MYFLNLDIYFRRKISSLFFALLIFSWSHIFCQAPGYMGKKSVVGYGPYISPVIFGSVSGSSLNKINIMHEFFIERAVKPRFSLGFSFKRYKTLYDNSGLVYIPPSYYYYRGYRPTGSYSIVCNSYNFYGKFYKRRCLAPWGKYMIFGLNVMKYKTIYDKSVMQVETFQQTNSYYVSTQPLIYSDFGPLEQEFTSADIFFGFGNSRIIADRIVIDYGYVANAFASLLTLADADKEEVLSMDPHEYIKVSSRVRLRGVNRLNVFLKLGFLF
jgi:hypothetical protein